MNPEQESYEKSAKILVVDDNPNNLFTMEKILQELDTEIFTALSAKEALSLLLRHEFALAFLDVKMPEMDGFELAELIRGNEETHNIPIIFITAYGQEQHYVFKGYEAGAVDFILKPFDPEILKQKAKVFLVLDEQKRLLEKTANELSQMNEKLQEAKDELELRVEKRTAELEISNKQLNQEIKKKERSEKKLRWELSVNFALADLSRELINPAFLFQDMPGITLEYARKLTHSRHGFVAYLDAQTKEAVAVTLTQMMGKACQVKGEDQRIAFPIGPDGRYPTLWGHALNTGKAFYTNSPGTHEASKGIPQGHIPLSNFLAAPAMVGEKPVGLIALSNSNTGYTDSELDAVNRLADLYAVAVQQKRAEEEIRRLNEELEQRVMDRTAQLEAANKEMHAFTYTVSHDLRAPLRHIDGYMELLKKKAGTLINGQGQHYMDSISQAAQKMGMMIDELLSFSRMGRHAPSFQQVDLGTLVSEVIRELEPDTAGRNIQWRIDSLPGVRGDAALLRMVVCNLISNAVKFTRPRDPARIEIGSIPGQGSETVIFVRDNGVGFDMTYADKLFGVFHRLHRSEEFEGTGIGLATVQRIIHQHGGRVWAESEVEKGSTIYFTIT